MLTLSFHVTASQPKDYNTLKYLLSAHTVILITSPFPCYFSLTMCKTISVHSFRGGTGKSNISANLSYSLTAAGKRVCVIDTDIQSPGIHVLLGIKEPVSKTLNDFLWGKAPIEEVAVDVSKNLGFTDGRSYLIPCSMNMAEIAKVIKQGYDVSMLNKGFREIIKNFDLDYLVIDTHPGLNEETLLSIAISDALFVVLRPDQQDFQGTSVTVEVARKLKVKNLFIVVNNALPYYDPAQIRKKVESVYGCPVATVLPHSEQMAELGSADLIVKVQPEDRWSMGIKEVTEIVLNRI